MLMEVKTAAGYVAVKATRTEKPKSRSVSGYGARIPTCWMIEWEGRKRRVYAAVHGNWPTTYIGKDLASGLVVEYI